MTVPGAGGVGALGQLRPHVAAAFGIDDQAVYFASLNLDRIAPAALKTAAFEDLGTYTAGRAGPRRRGRPGRAG